MQLEQSTRQIIDNHLTNRGWVLDPKESKQNVFFESPKTKEQKARLKNLRPDYVLYRSGSDQIIAIIETKKGGTDLSKAMEQAENYANLLNCPIIFASNGSSYQTKFLPNKKPLILDGDEVGGVLSEEILLKFIKASSNEAETFSKEYRLSRDELIKVFREANELLRSEGLRAGIERFSEFANILFLKLISEGRDKKTWWDSIKRQHDEDLIRFVNGAVIKEIEMEYGGGLFASLNITNHKILRKIISRLDELTLSTLDTDVKGDAFEHFLRKTTSTENDLGEYFTPRHITEAAVSLVDPKLGETIYDPFCGTGGFLTESFNHIKNNNQIEVGSDKEKILKEKTIFGGEITSNARIAKMNMILQGDGHSGVAKIDSLANPIDGKFDIAITNIPFSQKTEFSEKYENGLAKNNGDAVCALHCLRALKPGGRMALIVPEGFLFKKNLANFRKFLLSKTNLELVISLPQGSFLPYTAVKTNILYFTNAHQPQKRDHYWFFEVKNDGFTLDSHRRQIAGLNDLSKIYASDFMKLKKDEVYFDLLKQSGFELVPFEKIKNNDWNLIGKAYREVKFLGRKNWRYAKLGDVCSINPRKSELAMFKPDMEVSFVPMSDLNQHRITFQAKGKKLLSEVFTGYTYFEDGDVLFAKVTPCFENGKAGIARGLINGVGFGSSEFYVLRSGANVLPEWIYFCITHPLFRSGAIEQMTGSVGLQRVPRDYVESFQIPLPPLDEQRKIIFELECQESMIHYGNNLVDLWSSKNLDSENCAEEANTKSNLIDLLQTLESGSRPKGGIVPINGGAISLGGEQIGVDGRLDLRKIPFVPLDFYEKAKKGFVRNGDILMCKDGALTGKACYVYSDFEQKKVMCNEHVYIMRADETKILQKYLFYCLRDQQTQEQIKNLAYSKSAQPGLNQSHIERIFISLPPIEIQKQIIAEIEAEEKFIEEAKSFVKKQEEKIQAKLQSLWK